MKHFLLTWNPKYDSWPEYVDLVTQIKQGQHHDPVYWSFKSTKQVNVGDRFFLMKLGNKDKSKNGLIATGQIVSPPHNEPHWDNEKAIQGKTLPRVDLKFGSLFKKPVIDDKELKKDFSEFNWHQQNSGIKIHDNITDKLVKRWNKYSGLSAIADLSNEALRIYIEAEKKIRQISVYERNPAARQKCIDINGANCSVCGMNFEKTYGEIGKGFIHIHHLKEISTADSKQGVDPAKDLLPVCPNCHAMLHRKRPSYSIDEIKKKIRR